jgi:hypothetical protein
MDCRCSFKAFEVTLLHFKVDKMNWGSFSLKKMGNTHSGKPQKSLEKRGFTGIPRKFSSLDLNVRWSQWKSRDKTLKYVKAFKLYSAHGCHATFNDITGKIIHFL